MNYQEAHEFRFVGFLRSGHPLVALKKRSAPPAGSFSALISCAALPVEYCLTLMTGQDLTARSARKLTV